MNAPYKWKIYIYNFLMQVFVDIIVLNFESLAAYCSIIAKVKKA